MNNQTINGNWACVPQCCVPRRCVPQAFTPGNDYPTAPCAAEGVYALFFNGIEWQVPGVNAWVAHPQLLLSERGKGRKRVLVKLLSAFFRPGVHARPTELGDHNHFYSKFVNARPTEAGSVFHSDSNFSSAQINEILPIHTLETH